MVDAKTENVKGLNDKEIGLICMGFQRWKDRLVIFEKHRGSFTK
jgi:hypothetical protein